MSKFRYGTHFEMLWASRPIRMIDIKEAEKEACEQRARAIEDDAAGTATAPAAADGTGGTQAHGSKRKADDMVGGPVCVAPLEIDRGDI